MRIAIIGTGPVGRAFGTALTSLGHAVSIGTRDPIGTRERDEWRESPLELVGYQDLTADLFILATGGDGAIPALAAVGASLDGRVVSDASNPLDFSHGFPPSLSVCNTDSLAEQLQRAHPAAHIVKMFNTTANEVMINPTGLGEDSTLFVAGDDARATAAGVAGELGWTDILDSATSPRPAGWRCGSPCGYGSIAGSVRPSSTSRSSVDLCPRSPQRSPSAAGSNASPFTSLSR